MKQRFVHLTPRLSAALDLLYGYDTVADIGCDHGRLTAALLQNRICKRVIASDISESSLEKARWLIDRIGLNDFISFRVGDGCEVLKPNECDAIVLLGMGGTLMCRILDACSIPLMGAKAVVLQPMRAQDDIRRYLYEHRYHISEDQVVRDHGRLYQVLKAVPGEQPDSLPDGFPPDFYDVGYRAFDHRAYLLGELCKQQLNNHIKMLKTAAGTEGEIVLNGKIKALKQILHEMNEEDVL